MTKIQEYISNGSIQKDHIKIERGVISALDSDFYPTTVGVIHRVEVSVEYPETLIGICRVNRAILYNEADEELYDDQRIVDNTEYSSEKALAEAVAKCYGIEKAMIEVV